MERKNKSNTPIIHSVTVVQDSSAKKSPANHAGRQGGINSRHAVINHNNQIEYEEILTNESIYPHFNLSQDEVNILKYNDIVNIANDLYDKYSCFTKYSKNNSLAKEKITHNLFAIFVNLLIACKKGKYLVFPTSEKYTVSKHKLPAYQPEKLYTIFKGKEKRCFFIRITKFLIKWLESEGYIIVFKGRQNHYCTRIALTEKGIEFIKPLLAKQDYLDSLASVELRNRVHGRGENKGRVKIIHYLIPQKKYREEKEFVKNFVDCLENHSITLGHLHLPKSCKKIYNYYPKEEEKSKELKYNGQLYMPIQNIKSNLRCEILIDGEETEEMDVASSFLCHAYGIVKYNPYNILGGELYLPKGARPELRPLYKLLTNIMFASCSVVQAKEAFKKAVSEDPNLSDLFIKAGYFPVHEAIEEIRAHHYLIADYFFIGKKTMYTLLFQEASVMEKTLKWAIEEGIPIIPIHDSLLAKKSDINRILLKYSEYFKESTGFEPTMRTKVKKPDKTIYWVWCDRFYVKLTEEEYCLWKETGQIHDNFYIKKLKEIRKAA